MNIDLFRAVKSRVSDDKGTGNKGTGSNWEEWELKNLKKGEKKTYMSVTSLDVETNVYYNVFPHCCTNEYTHTHTHTQNTQYAK